MPRKQLCLIAWSSLKIELSCQTWRLRGCVISLFSVTITPANCLGVTQSEYQDIRRCTVVTDLQIQLRGLRSVLENFQNKNLFHYLQFLLRNLISLQRKNKLKTRKSDQQFAVWGFREQSCWIWTKWHWFCSRWRIGLARWGFFRGLWNCSFLEPGFSEQEKDIINLNCLPDFGSTSLRSYWGSVGKIGLILSRGRTCFTKRPVFSKSFIFATFWAISVSCNCLVR